MPWNFSSRECHAHKIGTQTGGWLILVCHIHWLSQCLGFSNLLLISSFWGNVTLWTSSFVPPLLQRGCLLARWFLPWALPRPMTSFRVKFLVFRRCLGETSSGHGGKRRLTFGISENGIWVFFWPILRVFYLFLENGPCVGNWALQHDMPICQISVKTRKCARFPRQSVNLLKT